MTKKNNYKNLLDKVENVTKQKDLDLSAGEDLSIAIMNLISIEEHLFFTSQKTTNDKYLELLNEIRKMRTELLRGIIKDYEGEVWCISKHLLAASMRVMEVGTKELKKGNKKKAKTLFEKSYKLYSLFWGINLDVVEVEDVERKDKNINFTDKSEKKDEASALDKLGNLVQKAIDCCKE